MQHIISSAFDFDDEAVTQKVEADAARITTRNLQNQVARKLFDAGPYTTDENLYKEPLTGYGERLVMGFLEAHKDEIIQAAGKCLAEKLVRTKAGKAAIEAAESAVSERET